MIPNLIGGPVKPTLLAAISVSLLALTGCASITDGTSQALIFKLDPRDARCTLTREGTELGSVSGRQSTITVGKSSRDIVVACVADGYTPKTMRLVSSTQAAGVAGGFFLDLGITDMITGAMWKYQNDVSIIMEREGSVGAQTPGAASNDSTPSSSSRPGSGPTDAQLTGGATSSGTPSAAPAPAAAVKAAPAAASSLPSQFSLEAERAAKAQQCGSPTSTLSVKGAGLETYSVTCSNGDVMFVRCEFGNCRVLR